jgi:hypothetical protein
MRLVRNAFKTLRGQGALFLNAGTGGACSITCANLQ